MEQGGTSRLNHGRELSPGRNCDPGEVQRTSVDEELCCCVQAPLLRGDRQGWQLPTAEPAAWRLHGGSLARKTGHDDAEDHHHCGSNQEPGFHFQSTLSPAAVFRYADAMSNFQLGDSCL